MPILFLAAYACSGLASLIYEVAWTRLLTLYMGHGLAAASTVVAAFMGGLAAGSFLGGRVAPRLTPARTLYTYIALELTVAAIAIVVPYELAALTPLLVWSYRNGAAGFLFSSIRLVSCLTVMFVPALALGATFPIAVRWFVRSGEAGRGGGALYAANTVGAAAGALAAGFVLIPAIGVRATTFVGIAAAGVACAAALVIVRRGDRVERPLQGRRRGPERRAPPQERPAPQQARSPSWLPAAALGISGFAALMYEIAWTRALALVVGPTTYAFSATVTALVAGTAIGSTLGAVFSARTRRPAVALSLVLALASIAMIWSGALIGGYVPRLIARSLARSSAFNQSLPEHTLLAAALLLPAAVCLGAAFPLAFDMAGGSDGSSARSISVVYAVNTVAAVGGSLAAGFIAIPAIGLQHTFRAVSLLVVIAAGVVVVWGRVPGRARVASLAPIAIALALVVWMPSWDRELLASGVYKYAQYVDRDLDLESALKSGTLVYYRDGAVSTVSLKRLTGTLSMSVDGKVDASNGGDMLTQKMLAHLLLLLHAKPRDVGIIGLGSGVTLGAALTHPVSRADVIEISPEVVDASRYFAADNRQALDDPRTRLIVGDGRSHLLLSSQQYDVIVSEPSNPWMAGVAALFTREFFTAVRRRLAPGGIVCQWAHTYDISEADFRSILATFLAVFPGATAWLVGDSDVLLVASTSPIDDLLANVARGWQRSGVAAGLRAQSVLEPFEILSLFAAGPAEISRFAAGAAVQTDDRTALEFSGPRAVANRTSRDNASALRQAVDEKAAPAAIRQAREAATAPEWRNRGAMLLAANDYGNAFDAYLSSLTREATDAASLDGFVRTSIAAHAEERALTLLESWAGTHPRDPSIRIAMSRLLAATGALDRAIDIAAEACRIAPGTPAALEQLASILADVGDVERLDPVVAELQRAAPLRAATEYYAGAARYLRRDLPAALGLVRQATTIDPGYAAAHNLTGAIEAMLGHTVEARRALETALRLDARDAATYVNLGLLEMSADNRAAAAGYFAEALSLDPKSTAARAGFARARQ
ncbi:MAG: hypothetical protein DMG03_03055 [Acidobacteria bacterium]|nr:MAG: hypothetical protein DMG03_03055 [Acidobacteriota bacterium]